MSQSHLSFWRYVFRTLGVVGFISAHVVEAHNPGLSFAEVELRDGQIVAQLTFSHPDIVAVMPIDGDADGFISPRELTAAQPRITGWARDLLVITMDGQRLPVIAEPVVTLEQEDAIGFQLRFQLRHGSKLQVQAPLMARLATGHRQFLSVIARSGQTHTGILSARQTSFRLHLAGQIE